MPPRREFRRTRNGRPRAKSASVAGSGTCALDRQAVGVPSGDGHEVVARRHVRLPLDIGAPAGQRTIGLQRQTVVPTRGDGHEVVTSRQVKSP